MEKCALCKKNDANQTGSHIIPLRILKSLVTDEEGSPRNKEITFGISSSTFDSYYFGRSVSKDKIENLLGREMTDEDREKNKKSNQFTEDFLCVTCEKRFSILENEFYKPYLEKFELFAFSEKTNEKIINGSETIRLFFISIIWRCSVTKFGYFNLDSSVEEVLRQILDDTMNVDKNILLKNISDKKQNISQFPIYIGIVKNKGNLTANNVFIHPINTTPYCFLINEFAVFFFPKNQPEIKQSFFNLEKIVTNYNDGEISVSKISLNDYENAINSIHKWVKENRDEKIKDWFSFFYETKKGVKPEEQLIINCINFINTVDQIKVDNFTERNIANRLAKFYNSNCN